MKLSDIKRDVVAAEAGMWVGNIPGMIDLALKVRGRDNADWRRLEANLVAAVPRSGRTNGRISPDEVDRITTTLLCDACLLDWRNLYDDEGRPIALSKDTAREYLFASEFKALRDAVLWAATAVADGTAVAAQ